MNRRRFFKGAAAFVAGCALGLGLKTKLDPVESEWESAEYEMDFIFHPQAHAEYMAFYDRQQPGQRVQVCRFTSDGVLVPEPYESTS